MGHFRPKYRGLKWAPKKTLLRTGPFLAKNGPVCSNVFLFRGPFFSVLSILGCKMGSEEALTAGVYMVLGKGVAANISNLCGVWPVYSNVFFAACFSGFYRSGPILGAARVRPPKG